MMNNITIVLISQLALSAFLLTDKQTSEYEKLRQLEHRALRNRVGRTYVFDLTHRKDCNKTRITYLGIVHTRHGKQYKILTSFFVFSAASTCHGTSSIKIFDLKNKYIGEYYVGTPDNLPDVLRQNKLLYLNNSADCDLRKTRCINLTNGLPQSFFIPCSNTGGDVYRFSSGR